MLRRRNSSPSPRSQKASDHSDVKPLLRSCHHPKSERYHRDVSCGPSEKAALPPTYRAISRSSSSEDERSILHERKTGDSSNIRKKYCNECKEHASLSHDFRHGALNRSPHSPSESSRTEQRSRIASSPPDYRKRRDLSCEGYKHKSPSRYYRRERSPSNDLDRRSSYRHSNRDRRSRSHSPRYSRSRRSRSSHRYLDYRRTERSRRSRSPRRHSRSPRRYSSPRRHHSPPHRHRLYHVPIPSCYPEYWIPNSIIPPQFIPPGPYPFAPFPPRIPPMMGPRHFGPRMMYNRPRLPPNPMSATSTAVNRTQASSNSKENCANNKNQS